MAGPGAFWCNAPPLEGTRQATRRFVIMGFNYERGVGEMLEDLGHRAESILSHVFRDVRGDANLWERFIRYDQKNPGRAECGNVHFAPNSQRVLYQSDAHGKPALYSVAVERFVAETES